MVKLNPSYQKHSSTTLYLYILFLFLHQNINIYLIFFYGIVFQEQMLAAQNVMWLMACPFVWGRNDMPAAQTRVRLPPDKLRKA